MYHVKESAVVLASIALSYLVAQAASAQITHFLRAWWAFALTLSCISIAALAGCTLLARLQRKTSIVSSLSTLSYFFSGPATGAIYIMSTSAGSFPAPSWAGSAMLLLFFSSAWLYYQVTGTSGESSEIERASRRIPER